MPISVRVDHDRHFVHVVLEGRIGLGELLEQLTALVQQGVMPYAKLFDACTADLDFSDADIMALAAHTRAYAELKPRGPVALVAVGEKDSGILWRFMNLSPGERPVAMFRTVKDGTDWLEGNALEK